MHPGWKIYGETFFQTRTGVWPLWQGEQHWKVPSRVSGFPTLQCLSSGNSRLLLGPLIRDTSATHLVIFSQQHILQMDILESAVDTGDPHHILCALPTGFGKTMPMLLLGHLLPPGAGCKISDPFALHNVLSRVRWSWSPSSQLNCSCWTTARGWACQSLLAARCIIYFWNINWYSYPMGVIGFGQKLTNRFPLLSLRKNYLSALKSWSATWSFCLQRRWSKDCFNCIFLKLPLQVKDAIMNTRLSPRGHRPIVCIDEAQVAYPNIVF